MTLTQVLYNIRRWDAMTLTPSRKKANDKYIANHYTRISLSMPNAEAEALRDHCAKRGHSVAGFIRSAIKRAIAEESETPNAEIRGKTYASVSDIIAEYAGDPTE